MAIGHADFARECADRKSSLSQETWHLLYERAIGERSMHGPKYRLARGRTADLMEGRLGHLGAGHMDSAAGGKPKAAQNVTRQRSAGFLRNKANRNLDDRRKRQPACVDHGLANANQN